MRGARLRALLPRGRFARGVSMVAGGTVASHLLSLALLPVLTRLFEPADFGVLATYLALLATAQAVVGLRYEMAIPLAPTDRDAACLLLVTLSVVSGFAVIALVAAALLLISPLPVAALTPLGGSIWLLPLGMVLTGVSESLRHWAVREGAYRRVGVARIAQGVGRGVAQVGSGLLRLGGAGLVVGEIVGPIASSMWLARSTLRDVKELWGGIGWVDARDAARRFADFPLMMAPASMLNNAGSQLPMLLLATLFGADVAGWYYVAHRAFAVPLQLSGGAFGQVFLGEAAPLAREDPAALDRLFRSLTRRLLLAGALPTIAAVLLGPWVMTRFLGPQWSPSGVYLQWLAVSFLLKFAYDGLINLAIVKRNDYALAWAAGRLTLTCGAVIGAYAFRLSPTTCIALLSIALSLGYLFKLLLWRRAVNQLREAIR